MIVTSFEMQIWSSGEPPEYERATKNHGKSFRISEDKRLDDVGCQPQNLLTSVALTVLQIVVSATFRPKKV